MDGIRERVKQNPSGSRTPEFQSVPLGIDPRDILSQSASLTDGWL
jgi:hypothetical protein